MVITEQEFQSLAGYIKKNYGINLKDEKKSLVTSRLQNVLTEKKFESFSQYFEYIISDRTGEAVITLIDKITTNHTYFMREAEHFYFFRDKVLSQLKNSVKSKDLAIWCAASSSGEEAYTLAMIIDEFFGQEKFWWDTKVLATDISEKVLTIAKRGHYSESKIAPLPIHWKNNYFKKVSGDIWTVVDRIKEEVIYRKFNLMEPVFPFKKKFHIIFCRNVMIYFDNKTRDELVEKFYNSMEYGGYLFIGHSESLDRQNPRFKYISPAIYRKE